MQKNFRDEIARVASEIKEIRQDLLRQAGEAPTWSMGGPLVGIVNQAFVDKVKKSLSDSVMKTPRGFTLTLADHFNDPQYSGGSEYDIMFTEKDGEWSIRFPASKGKVLIQKLKTLTKVTPAT